MSSPLIEAPALHERSKHPGLTILDGSWYMPAEARNTAAEFEAGHIPGASFFDLDAISDRTSNLPHMLPPQDQFQAAVRELGVGKNDDIVIYDTSGIFSAARVWWSFRVAGAKNVYVLNGGLPAWHANGFPLETGASMRASGDFEARYHEALVTGFDDILAMTDSERSSILDARSEARFKGTAPDPRQGVSAGHIAGSRNVPFNDLLAPDGKLKTTTELSDVFKSRGANLDGRLMASCGSGVTAAIIALALASLGREDVAIYDGAWTEWGSRPESAHLVATAS